MLSSTPKLKHATIESCEEARGHVDKHILYTIASCLAKMQMYKMLYAETF